MGEVGSTGAFASGGEEGRGAVPCPALALPVTIGIVTLCSFLVWLLLAGRGAKLRSLPGEAQLPLPVVPKELGDASALHGTGKVEAAVAACLLAGDSGPALPTDEALLERAQQPPSAAASGPPQPAPHLPAGRSLWPLLGHSPQICLADEAVVPEPLWSCQEQDFCPRAAWKGWDFSHSRKALLAPISHLLHCLLDRASNIHKANPIHTPLLTQIVGKKLQRGKGEELIKREWGARPLGKLEGTPRNSPGKTHGHRAPASTVCAHRCLGQPLPGCTACMLEGREQTPAGMNSSGGPGATSLRDCPQGLFCGCPAG